MDNEKAIKVLTELLESINPNDLGKEHIMNYAQALTMAIEALKRGE